MSKTLRQILKPLVAALTLSVTATAAAQPPKPVRIIVPFPPGGTTDILARDVANQLTAKWGAVIVENKAGASGSIGSQEVVRAAPDGHTLLLTATHHVINPSLRANLPYDTKKDFTALNLIALVPNVLVVHPGFPAKSVADLIRMAKEKPGSISFGSTGIGGANHLSGELFKAMTGIDMQHVPYKGAAPALNDLLGGQIPVMFDSVPGVLQHIQAGRLRALGVTTKTRVASLPDVPTIDEAGVKGFEATAWFGLYGPPKMPAELASRINREVNEILATQTIKERFAKFGAEPGNLGQAEFARYVESEIDKWSDIVKRAGVKAE
jgi:tripartite-type tricarboxylate transporter receptor subunit TctC